MKVAEIVLMIICLTLSAEFVSFFCLIPASQYAGPTDCMTRGTTPTFDANWSVNQSDHITAKYMTVLRSQEYTKSAVTTTESQTQFLGDFMTGFFIFVETLAAAIFYLRGLLAILSVPQPFHFIIIYPVWFMYLVGVFQIISGRLLEKN